jgi:D-amino-acid dehydrogenase
VLALGSYSRAAAGAAGLESAGVPGQGLFAHRADLVDAERAPVSTVMDETYKVAPDAL